mgnify:CR=1 FL=1
MEFRALRGESNTCIFPHSGILTRYQMYSLLLILVGIDPPGSFLKKAINCIGKVISITGLLGSSKIPLQHYCNIIEALFR